MQHGISRLLWAFGAIYMSCAALRLARFNVSNEHGEQHHFSFLGMPSPGAGGVVAGYILMHHELGQVPFIGRGLEYIFPIVVLTAGLLMISNIRYPHLVNRYLRGRKPLGMMIPILLLVPLIVWKHRIVIGLGTLMYMLWGLGLFLYPRTRNAAFGLPTAPGTPPSDQTPPASEPPPSGDLPTPPAST
jgi:CDP-diacylglycerol--serine O-phosphatidyltransferase